MTSPRRLGCAALLATALLIPATALPASADFETVTDRSGDVTALDFTAPPKERGTAAPEETQADVTRVDVDYRKRVLVAVIEVAEVRRQGKAILPFVRVKGGGRDNTFTRGTGGALEELRPRYPEYGCKGGSVTINPAKATYRFKIPVECIEAADKVRVGASAARFGPEDTLYADDARTGRASQNSVFAPRLGKALGRG